MGHIFISYSRKEEKFVDRLCAELDKFGYHDWLDRHKLVGGTDWENELHQAIRDCAVVVLVLSPNSLASSTVAKELTWGQEEKKPLVPVLVKKPKKMPPELSFVGDAQWVTEFKDDFDDGVKRLIQALERHGLAPSKPPLEISISRLPITPHTLFGREKPLTMLNKAWDDKETNVLSLVAWGGVGKTALVNRWLNDMGADDYRGAEVVYGWSFYSQGTDEDRQASADEFIATSLREFGDPEPDAGSPWEKGVRLADLVRKHRTLLILDGLEPLQYPVTTAEELRGKLKDQGMQALLRELSGYNTGLCIISTRVAVDDLKGRDQPVVIQTNLETLTPEAGAAYLAHLGVMGTEKELRDTTKEYDGHALALTLLGNYLRTVHKGEIRKKDLVPALFADKEQGGHARRVMACYESWYADKPELSILKMMGLFDRPVEVGARETLLKEPAIQGLTEVLVSLSEADWSYALDELRAVGLLGAEDPHCPGDLDCHPLVREHFGERLQNEYPGAWKEAHSRLYEYYRDLPEKHQPDTLEEMAPLYAAIGHGCRADRHQEVFDGVYWERVSRGNEGYSTKKLGTHGADLAALAGFFETPWGQPAGVLTESDQAIVLNLAAYALRALGRLAEAAQPEEAGLKLDIERKDWHNAAIAVGNLSELHLVRGALEEAREIAEQGVTYADQSEEDFQRLLKRAKLAFTLHALNRRKEAKTLFEQAESIQKELQPSFPRLYSLQGYLYCDLLLEMEEIEEVKKRAEEALKLVLQYYRNLLDVALNQLAIGRAHFLEHLEEKNKASLSAAENWLNKAVAMLRQSGEQGYLSAGLIYRTALWRAKKDWEKAKHDLEEAMEIATRGGMRLYECDAHLEYARLFAAMGEKEKAKEHYEVAKKMVEEMKYHRRDEELEALREELEG
jgi:tetratricopeptide (TPR) repeat protein